VFTLNRYKITQIPRHTIKKHLQSKAHLIGLTPEFVKHFLQLTWHRDKVVSPSRVRTTIGFAHDTSPQFVWESNNTKFINSIEAYMNFMDKYKHGVFENPRYYQNLYAATPRLVAPQPLPGRAHLLPGAQPSIPTIGCSKPPPADAPLIESMNRVFGKEMPDTYEAASVKWHHANRVVNDEAPYQSIFKGSKSHQSFMPVKRPVTRAEKYGFLQSRACVTAQARVAAAITLSVKKDYTRFDLKVPNYGSEKEIEKIADMPVAIGMANFNCADKRFGNTHGTKRSQDFVVKNSLMCMIRAFKDLIDADCAISKKTVQPISYWGNLINKFFLDGQWKYFYHLHTILFRKAETIQVGKTPRVIWGCDLLNICVDYLTKWDSMKATKNNFQRGFTHGITAKGAGFVHYHNQILNYYLDQLNTKPHLATRVALCEYLGLPLDCSDIDLSPKLAPLLVGKDDDVSAWDFAQYIVSFEAANMVYLYQYGINPHAVDVVEAIWLMLMCYSSHQRATTTVNVKPEGADVERNTVVQNLPSGYLGTAKDGSTFHSFIQHEAQIYKYLMASSVLKKTKLLTPRLRLCALLATLGTPANHHSDDFIDLVIALATIFHSLFDDQYHYAMSNLSLKYEKTNNVRNLPVGLTWDKLSSLVDSQWLNLTGYGIGTDEGLIYNNGSLIKDVKLFTPQVRFSQSFKPFFSVYDKDDNRLTDGVTFLQWRFRLYRDDYFIVTRDPERLLAKAMRMSTTILTPAQMVMRLRAFMFLSVGNKKMYECFSRVEDEYREHHKLTDASIADSYNTEQIKELVNLMSFKLDGMSGKDIMKKPTYDQILAFYGPGADNKIHAIRNRHNRDLYAPSKSNTNLVRLGQPKSFNPVNRHPVIVSAGASLRLLELRKKILESHKN